MRERDAMGQKREVLYVRVSVCGKSQPLRSWHRSNRVKCIYENVKTREKQQ